MQESMYTAMFAAMTQEHRMDIIANNLANVNTTGYKTCRQAFEDVFISFAHDNIREPMMNMRSKQMYPNPDYYAKVRIAESRIDMSQGTLKQTGNPLDVAITGEGFFKIQDFKGDTYYTRDGTFHVNPEGVLVNTKGHRVLGDGGPIELPQNAKIFIDGRGQIYANNEQIGALQVVNVDKPEALTKFGHTYFQKPQDVEIAETPMPDESVISQGYLEAPNIEIVTEMVNMIETNRAFEAYQKVITTTGETDNRAISRVGTNS